MRERYLGVKIPPTNLKPDFADEARRFADDLADGLPRRQPQPNSNPRGTEHA